MKIGIIGPGTVGKAIGKYYEKRNYSVMYFDEKYNDEQYDFCELYYICIPTPHDKDYRKDIENIIKKITPHSEIIIKSTISPIDIQDIKNKFPERWIRYSPEFIDNDTAELNFETDLPLNIGDREAALVKLSTNFYYAMKVVFFNMIYDICQKEGLDYEQVRKYLVNNPDISDSHSEIWHKGYRGYGGHCLPKDVKILIDYMKILDIEPSLPLLVESMNNKYKEDK